MTRGQPLSYSTPLVNHLETKGRVQRQISTKCHVVKQLFTSLVPWSFFGSRTWEEATKIPPLLLTLPARRESNMIAWQWCGRECRECLSVYSFYLLFFFFMWAICKSLLNLLQCCFFFYVLVFWLPGMCNLSSLIRDQIHIPCNGRWSLNHWTAREVPAAYSLKL